MLIPKRLPRQAVIGIISPASPQRDQARLDRGIRYLESLGYRVELGPAARRSHAGYLAGTDEDRLSDLMVMFENDRIDAIMCARGGYGTMRLLEGIDYRVIRRHPKIFVGFSDTTALQLAIWKKTSLVTFSGAMPSVDMADTFDGESEEWFWRMLTSARPLGPLKQSLPVTTLRRGAAEGRLLGGNLSVFVSLLGTPWMPVLEDSVLVLEDVGEETYRIDRMLTQISLAGIPSSCAATVFGQFTQKVVRGSSTQTRDISEVLTEYATRSTGPVLGNLMYGHERKKLTLPMGIRASISARSRYLKLVDAAVR